MCHRLHSEHVPSWAPSPWFPLVVHLLGVALTTLETSNATGGTHSRDASQK